MLPVRSKSLFELASVPPVHSESLFEPAVQDHYSKVLVSVALCSESLYSALLCYVHGYARVHTSILYIRHRAACQRCWCDQWALSRQLGSLTGLEAPTRPPGLQLNYLFIGSPPPARKFLSVFCPLPFLHQNFNLSKNGLWGAIWCPKCPKVSPKASQMEPWPVILMTFFAKSRLCIRLHIYYVLDTF